MTLVARDVRPGAEVAVLLDWMRVTVFIRIRICRSPSPHPAAAPGSARASPRVKAVHVHVLHRAAAPARRKQPSGFGAGKANAARREFVGVDVSVWGIIRRRVRNRCFAWCGSGAVTHSRRAGLVSHITDTPPSTVVSSARHVTSRRPPRPGSFVVVISRSANTFGFSFPLLERLPPRAFLRPAPTERLRHDDGTPRGGGVVHRCRKRRDEECR